MTRSFSSDKDSVGRFQDLWSHSPCFSAFCLRRFDERSAAIDIEPAAMASRKTYEVASSHGLPSGSSSRAFPGLVAESWRDFHESLC
jgi:hypothetical protein